jgi:periplasmic protein TonB
MSNPSSYQRHPYLAKLESWRAPIFNFSLLCSLGIVTYAFNWTSYGEKAKPIDTTEITTEPVVEVIRTSQTENRMPPPPVMNPSTEVIPDEIEYTSEPQPEPVDDKIVVDDAPLIEPVFEPSTPNSVARIEPVIEPEAPDNIPFIVVEDMPRFNGCEDITGNKAERAACATNKLLAYIYKNIRYPSVARENRIEGTVVIQFTIEKEGSITDINILKEIGGGCGTEAARVVRSMPDWIPGKQRGKAVRVRYSLPVRYTLN